MGKKSGHKAQAQPAPPSAPTPAKDGYPPMSMQELLEKMNVVTTFNITTVKGGKRDCFQMPKSGAIEFYADAGDALEALQAAQAAAGGGVALELEAVPLGKAFSVAQGLMGLTTPVPTKLYFSRAVVAAVGERGIPEAMREDMRGAGPLPLFSVEELKSPGAMPVYLSYEDLTASWMRSGRPLEELPPAPEVAIDLRVLAASCLQDNQDYFKKLLFVAPRSSLRLYKELATRREASNAVRENMIAAKAIVDAQLADDAVSKAAHVDDAPPPLMSDVAAA